MNQHQLKDFLDLKVEEYNQPGFIANDPVCIPHSFTKKQDIEIAGLMAAVFAWGQRKTIINKSHEFLRLMDDKPHEFVLNYSENDLKPFLAFKHRTFNSTDALYFLYFFRWFYERHDSLEEAFVGNLGEGAQMEAMLTHFFELFFSLPDHPVRTYKHIPNPARKSACKRINMFLRWMVRQDDKGVDFGIWKKIKPDQLVCPCDLHVDRVARKLGLIKRKQTDWLTAKELTQNLKKLDPLDPVKYDFALFGLGVEEKF
ncbi:TIGR02757 family protein [Ekhidna lutea]|uniref:TIGR02757 family protein n=1 Tax=Ekhidna lutea TaxID=447679 RepID=A0A239M6R9_EKHLU|nr:TIGR02757 family protein [Ekhidna lutea]SNT37842.1 TIGR02757 family protein [Ekhidna lutea]